MKTLLLLGGMAGFVIGISFGLAAARPLPLALLQACATAYGAGLLLRWWGRVWVKSLLQANAERRRG